MPLPMPSSASWCPSFSRSFVMMPWSASKASMPNTRNSAMWETSKMPTRLRTALCSSTMPAYSMGMS